MKFLVAMILTALVLTACGGDASDEADPTVPEGTPGSVVLEIADEGGFVPVEFNLARVPRFTVFADGRVVMADGGQFVFPAPAVVSLVEAQLDAGTMEDLLTFVGDLGLADIDSVELSEGPNVADASTTVVRYFDAGGEHRISVYALGFDVSSRDARPAIVASMVELVDLAAAGAERTPYLADRYVVHALPTDGFDPQQVVDAGPWPLQVSPDEMTEEVVGFPCTTVHGESAAHVASVLASATAMTSWSYEGVDYRIVARPLLPHQDGC